MASGAWCGSRFVPSLNPGDRCPSGAKATYSVNGTNEPEAKSSMEEASTLTGTVPWNVNTGPVQVGLMPGSTYSGGIPGPDQPNVIPFNEAQLIVNELRGKARAGDESGYKDFVGALRRYTNSALGTTDTIDEAWRKVLTDAQVAGVDAFALLNAGPEMLEGELPETGPRGPGAYTGPRTTVSMASERDLRMTADAVASTVLGRAVTDDEFQSVLEQVRSAERAEPTITTSGVGSTVTQAGLTAEGRQNIITEALMQGPEAEDFGKATKMMDLFYSALEARPEGA